MKRSGSYAEPACVLSVHRKPSTKVEDVLLALQQLLVEPNPDDPLIPAIAEQYRTDKAGFKKEAQLQVKKVSCQPYHRPWLWMKSHLCQSVPLIGVLTLFDML